MVLSFLKKKDIWSEVGGVDGYLDALKQLAPDYRQLDNTSSGYTKPDSIWGQLAELTQISNKNTIQTRKWLFTAWHENRRKIRTTFLSIEPHNIVQQTLNVSCNSHEEKDQLLAPTVSLCFLFCVIHY